MSKEDNEELESGRDRLGRFTAGNKWASLRGFFQSPEQMQEAISEYFEMSKQKNGVYKPTLTGMVYHIGLANLKSLYDYEAKEPYSYTVKRARSFIQSCYESNLYGFAWGGAAFALKNIGKGDWTDEVTQHQIVTDVKANFGSTIQSASESGKDT
jgi:hypothetical protein